jgi:hypothetical protein
LIASAPFVPERREGRRQVGGATHVDDLQLDAERATHIGDRLHLRGEAERWVA